MQRRREVNLECFFNQNIIKDSPSLRLKLYEKIPFQSVASKSRLA